VSILSTDQRKELERACVLGRRVAEAASRAAIGTLGILDERPPVHISEEDRDLRRGLRAKRDQLGDRPGQTELLVADCAYEQWHRLLFARFLAENNLLIHPRFEAPVTLAECDELAADLGEPDAWAVASRFAAEILPGIFRLDDPCVRLQLAPEGRLALEQIVESLAAGTFAADDALGWVYQHWQKERKDEVNSSERKIGGADLAPVTQLFTEHYMVRFLLENSLGAWWAGRHPDSPLLTGWNYLRYDTDGTPAGGAFEGWPAAVAEVTVIDPCCGSGHFLVEAFGMLWRMRAEEEHLAPVAAQDAVLRDNLFGLELDPRCVQIAMFAVALMAWKDGGGWRDLPVPNIACAGIPVKADAKAWTALADGNITLQNALSRLHVLFKDADTLGSLIDPRHAAEFSAGSGPQATLDDVDWDTVAPLCRELAKQESTDPARHVLGAGAESTAVAAELLAARYTLVVTNVPYLTRSKQGETLTRFSELQYNKAKADLATVFLERCRRLVQPGGTDATVSPQNWLFLGSYASLREDLLSRGTWNLLARIGLGATSTKSWDTLRALLVATKARPPAEHAVAVVDAFTADDYGRATDLRHGNVRAFKQATQLDNPAFIVTTTERALVPQLDRYAVSPQGTKTGDDARCRRYFWELPSVCSPWRFFQSTVSATADFDGCESIVRWERGGANLARPQGQSVWGRRGVAVSLMRALPASRYEGEPFDSNVGILMPHDASHLPALWMYVSSAEYNEAVREIDPGLRVVNASLLRVPFELDRWRAAAEEKYPNGLPAPASADPTQWVFDGWPERSTAPLQVAVARLLGYRWPRQPDPTDLDELADEDGIVCIPSVLGERTAADRLQDLLARAFGGTWSPARATELLIGSGSKKADLDLWLRDEFFKAHCQLFKFRPFVWHIWDGRRDGFGALVNYHRLDRPTLERLTYSYLGDWIERQAAGAREDAVGADERLMAARELQGRLALILSGEPPHDVYVRWKPIAEQASGWTPDVDDGVRLNLRPFVLAGVLRAKFNVKWEKDRGKNPDGSERRNDVHLTNDAKQATREVGPVA
jgi:hypothetical protein